MKKFKLLAMITIALGFALVAFAAEAKKDAPLGFKEADLIGTIKEIVVVNAERNLQYWTVKLDGKDLPYHLFTDEKGKVGERVVIYLVVRVPNGPSWSKVSPFNQ